MRFGGGVVQVLWTVNDDGAATHSAGRPGFGKHLSTSRKQALFMGSSTSPAVACQDEHAYRNAVIQRRAADAADAADATGAAPGKPGQVGCHGNAPT
jgi:hypothetical protein